MSSPALDLIKKFVASMNRPRRSAKELHYVHIAPLVKKQPGAAPNVCKKCKFIYDSGPAICRRPISDYGVDLVTGARTAYRSNMRCGDERASTDAKHCGPEGKFFVQRQTIMMRVKRMFSHAAR